MYSTDTRRPFDGLVALTHNIIDQNPLSGYWFVLVNRIRDCLKHLYYCKSQIDVSALADILVERFVYHMSRNCSIKSWSMKGSYPAPLGVIGRPQG